MDEEFKDLVDHFEPENMVKDPVAKWHYDPGYKYPSLELCSESITPIDLAKGSRVSLTWTIDAGGIAWLKRQIAAFEKQNPPTS